jgi:hypothetical protein
MVILELHSNDPSSCGGTLPPGTLPSFESGKLVTKKRRVSKPSRTIEMHSTLCYITEIDSERSLESKQPKQEKTIGMNYTPQFGKHLP